MEQPRMEPTQLLTTEQRARITGKMEAYLLKAVGCGQQSRPPILRAATDVVSAMSVGLAGKWLRRYLKEQKVLTAAKEVLWGWAAQQGIAGWLQLTGGRPQTGAGPPLEEWRVQAVEMGGWRAMLRQGDTAWMAGFRMRVLQALQQYHETTPAGLCTVSEDTVEEVWLHSAKAWSRMVPGGKQSRDLYDLALIQLQQHQRLALEQGQVHTQRRVRQCVQTALGRGAQVKGAVSKQVTQAGKTPVVRDVVVDLCAGRQSMRGPAKRSGYRYVAVELLAVIEALGGKRKAQVVLDISAVEPEELLKAIAAQAGIAQEEILFIWASVPCTTLGAIDSSNQRPGYTWHRDYSKHSQKRCRCGAIAVTGGTREPRTPRAVNHDRLALVVVTALDALYNLYGVHYAIENPRASLRMRPLMLSLVQSERVRLELVNYCQYSHIFAKATNVWTTVGWEPKGSSGTGLCRAETGYCSSKTGFIKEDTGRWNHYNVIAGEHSRSIKGSVLVKDELQNRVPAKLLTEILVALKG